MKNKNIGERVKQALRQVRPSSFQHVFGNAYIAKLQNGQTIGHIMAPMGAKGAPTQRTLDRAIRAPRWLAGQDD